MIEDYNKVISLVNASSDQSKLDDCKDAAEIFLDKHRKKQGVHKYYEKILNKILEKENINQNK
jgi:hypothetical protein